MMHDLISDVRNFYTEFYTVLFSTATENYKIGLKIQRQLCELKKNIHHFPQDP